MIDKHIFKVYFMHTMDIPGTIKKIRKDLGLTQTQLAEKIGSNRFNIANYETARAVPPTDTFLKIQGLLAAHNNQDAAR